MKAMALTKIEPQLRPGFGAVLLGARIRVARKRTKQDTTERIVYVLHIFTIVAIVLLYLYLCMSPSSTIRRLLVFVFASLRGLARPTRSNEASFLHLV